MMMIRFSRLGKKKYPTYRLVVQDKRNDPWGKTKEIIGHYNPHSKELVCGEERLKYWLSVGAKLSATVNNLLVRKNIIKAMKMKASRPRYAQFTARKLSEEEKKKTENKAVPSAPGQADATAKKE